MTKEIKDIKDYKRSDFLEIFPKYSKTLWDFLSENRELTSGETYKIILNNLRLYEKDDLLSIKQLIKINTRRHPLLKPLLNVIKTSMKLLASFGLFSILFSSLRISTHIKFIFTEYLITASMAILVIYFLFLFFYELSIIFVENQRRYHITHILVELIDEVIGEKELVTIQTEEVKK